MFMLFMSIFQAVGFCILFYPVHLLRILLYCAFLKFTHFQSPGGRDPHCLRANSDPQVGMENTGPAQLAQLAQWRPFTPLWDIVGLHLWDSRPTDRATKRQCFVDTVKPRSPPRWSICGPQNLRVLLVKMPEIQNIESTMNYYIFASCTLYSICYTSLF